MSLLYTYITLLYECGLDVFVCLLPVLFLSHTICIPFASDSFRGCCFCTLVVVKCWVTNYTSVDRHTWINHTQSNETSIFLRLDSFCSCENKFRACPWWGPLFIFLWVFRLLNSSGFFKFVLVLLLLYSSLIPLQFQFAFGPRLLLLLFLSATTAHFTLCSVHDASLSVCTVYTPFRFRSYSPFHMYYLNRSYFSCVYFSSQLYHLKTKRKLFFLLHELLKKHTPQVKKKRKTYIIAQSLCSCKIEWTWKVKKNITRWKSAGKNAKMTQFRGGVRSVVVVRGFP